MERLVDVVTPLGEALWFRQMTGTECISELFEFDVTFHSDKTTLSAKAMLGKDVTMKIETGGGLGSGKTGTRYFNGIVTRFASGGREGQHLTFSCKLRPWLWLASRRSDCKIFQFKTVPQIIQEVLGVYGFPISMRLKGKYRPWDYCVQYQETDLNFVMRLMEHEGIYFFFEHAMGRHTLVMMDDISSHAKLPEKPTIQYFGLDASAVVHEEHFNSWDIREEVDPGEYETRDYDFEKPKDTLITRKNHQFGHSHDKWQRYMYPGGYTQHPDGEEYAKVRLQTLQAEQERAQGHCTVRTMAPGFLFKLERCPRADQNREYLSIAATYFFRDNARMSAGSGDGDAAWSITVTSQPTSVPYRPQPLTPKPITHGPQTAVVVGPAGEEIYTDKYGRVKVQFFWDRYGRKDENSSCWIRVSHPWAGDKWGFIHIPRIGQEVIVDFIGGDPDYPMITGRVYNADMMPPYELPKNKTASGIKSRSTKGGTATDFNEIRMEDMKGKEQLYVHAQRNLDTVVEADESRMVGHDRSTRIEHDDDRFVNHDDRHVVTNNQSVQINNNQTISVSANQDNTVNRDQSNMVDGMRTQNIGKDLKEKTGGNHTETIGGNHTFSTGGKQKSTIGGNQSNLITGSRKSMISGEDATLVAGAASYSAQRYNVMGGTQYSETCMTRKAVVMGTDDTKVVGMQTEKIGGMRDTTIGGVDKTTVIGAQTTTVGAAKSTTVGGVCSTTAGGAMTLTAGAAISITGGGVVTVTAGGAVNITGGGTVMITAPLVMMNTAMVKVAGVVLAKACISAPIIP
jgi:type VI secretion system secreted protein VgrG